MATRGTRSRGGRGGGRGGGKASKSSQPVHYDNGALEMAIDIQVTAIEPAQPLPQPVEDIRAPNRRGRSRVQEHTTSTVPAAPSTLPPAPVADSSNNPFVSGNTATSEAHTPPLEVRLNQVAAPAVERPRAGPHSPRSGRSRSSSASEQEAGSRRGRNRHAAQDVWSHFVKHPYMMDTYDCIFCEQLRRASKAQFSSDAGRYQKSSGTGSMRRHLIKNHCDDWIRSCIKNDYKISAKKGKIAKAEYLARNGGASAAAQSLPDQDTIPPFSQEAFTDALVDFIVEDDQSINVVESPPLRRVFRILREGLQDSDIPHRTTIRKRIGEKWEDRLDGLRKEFENCVGKVSFTTDLWSDPNLTPFMAVTAHWIEVAEQRTPEGPITTLKLRAELIGFHRVPGRHTGEHLSLAFNHVLKRVGITGDKIGWVTLDNASNNDTMMEHLAQTLSRANIPFSSIDSRIRCFPHIVNLACKAVLTAITNLKLAEVDDNTVDITAEVVEERGGLRDVIALGRSVVRAIRVSSLRRGRFADLQLARYPQDTPLELLRDVDTRWSSTLLMIERLLELKEFVTKMIADNPELRKYELDDAEWSLLQEYSDILKVPHAFQQVLSSEKTPTLHHALPCFQAMVAKWKAMANEKPLFADIINAGIEKLEEYMEVIAEVPAYTLAILINPAYKILWFQNHMPSKVNWAKTVFHDALKPYRAAGNVNTPAPARRPATGRSANWAAEFLGSGPLVRESDSRSLVSEIAAYFADSRVASTTLRYWQDNRYEYPTIFRLAMDILPIQGSAVPCERVFSSAKETMTARRSRIKPELMESLQMLKFARSRGRSLDFTAGTSAEDQIQAMEADHGFVSRVPDDITMYVRSLVEDPDSSSDSEEGDDEIDDEEDDEE